MRTSGLFQHPLFQRHLFRTPAVRHLAWLVHSQPLLNIGAGNEAVLPWPADIDTALIELDRCPQPLLAHLAHLAQRGSGRLGLYFEQLYGFALIAFLGQRILAQNLPLRVQGRTLGELDFLVQDPASGQVVHHEIAVKFYMGWTGEPEKPGKPAGWYGPDTRDHLSAKLKRLREHQLPMWQSQLGREYLRTQGLAEPRASVLGLYGYLFEHAKGGIPALPEGIGAPEHGMTWCRTREHEWARSPENPGAAESFRVLVRKPDWLGPLQYPADYRPPAEERTTVMDLVSEASRRAVLLATLQRTEQGFWMETRRQFLTPDHWCLGVPLG